MFMCQERMVMDTIHSNPHPSLELGKTQLGWGKKKDETESKDEVKAKDCYLEKATPSIRLQYWG